MYKVAIYSFLYLGGNLSHTTRVCMIQYKMASNIAYIACSILFSSAVDHIQLGAIFAWRLHSSMRVDFNTVHVAYSAWFCHKLMLHFSSTEHINKEKTQANKKVSILIHSFAPFMTIHDLTFRFLFQSSKSSSSAQSVSLVYARELWPCSNVAWLIWLIRMCSCV